MSFSPLKVLGATEDEVHIERAFILCSSAQERSATDKRAFVEFSIDTEEELAAPVLIVAPQLMETPTVLIQVEMALLQAVPLPGLMVGAEVAVQIPVEAVAQEVMETDQPQ